MDVLVVDDAEDIRVMLELFLRGRGHSPVLAASAAEARAALAHRTFDAMLLDVTLPDEQGPDLVRSLRADDLLPPRVALLSAVRPAALEVMAEGLDVVHLTKPFDVAALDELLSSMQPDAAD